MFFEGWLIIDVTETEGLMYRCPNDQLLNVPTSLCWDVSIQFTQSPRDTSDQKKSRIFSRKNKKGMQIWV